MTLAVVHSRALDGMHSPLITVEVHISNGLPGLSIVGLPETAVKESKDRVRGALLTSQFEFPARRITINLAPADLPKEGARFDLPIALGILAATGQIPADSLAGKEFVGELALSGELRPIRGILPVSIACRNAGHSLFCPVENTQEATLVKQASIHPVSGLLEVCRHLTGDRLIPTAKAQVSFQDHEISADMAEVHGQSHAKRALEIAAAGGHSLLLIGPPGTGKTMLSSRLPGILPEMSEEEALETASIASVSGLDFNATQWKKRPFRSPHHTASGVALVGGGSHPKPGEISLAHNGVMFLDELPEFSRKVLEVLREPLESGRIMISRAARQAEYPARFQLVAAMNPCPCGYLGDPKGRCHCTPDQILRYRNRISGPIMDRIDMHVEVPAIGIHQLHTQKTIMGESSQEIRKRVLLARQHQESRGHANNAMLNNREVESFCRISPGDHALLESALEKLGLSIRAYHRVLKVARTIADLDNADEIRTQHLTEAISYRRLDRTISP